ncbi:DUF937 domain-containing protein [Lutibacter sp. A80]|uniref:DUF937 domain-containing protein n=1 Tax=Lutibacter sp. A80 TaxID=2918453 RepID=UPI001F0649BF|nr:DUF937 domain-containing protein [Lutibacter sp. A80]UMB61459.1 DUF937 domain-containing protein [Lutibacter sp. A80]
MSGILDLLNSDLGKTLISGASKQFGEDEGKTTSALSTALPLILGAMKNNASTSEGASGLLSALGDSKHSGGILDNLGSVLGGSGVDEDVLSDGAGILSHVFNGKEENVAQAVSKSSGIDLSSAMNILKVAGPLVMGALGKETREQDVSDENGIGNLLSGMLGGESSSQQSLVNQLLDADGDGSVIDDVAGMLLGGSSKDKSGLGGMLGGLFGK